MAKGRVIIDVERCKGCELCINACPQDVLALSKEFNSKGYRPVFWVEHENDCTGCALCAVACPDGCITVFREMPQKKRPSVTSVQPDFEKRGRVKVANTAV